VQKPLRRPPSAALATAAACVILAATRYVSQPVIAAASPAPAETRTIERSRAQEAVQPQFTIQARVPLTIVDVTVTDAKGQPVHNLKQSDFTILEDNKEMKPNSFEEYSSDEARPVHIPVKQELPPNTFSNTPPTAQKLAPPAMLVIDNLNTPAQAQQQLAQRLLDFARKMPAGTQMTVYLLTNRLTILQGFTSDPKLIEAALTNKKAIAHESPLADPSTAAAGESTEVEGNQNSMRAQYTLTALRQIARFASGIPGRKNLVWFSGSFPTTFPPHPDPFAFPVTFCPPPTLPDACPTEPTVYDFETDVKSVTDLLARSHVTVYPIDARGIQIPDPPVIVPYSTTKMTNRMNLRVAEHETMDTIAELTGGKAVYNSNDFAGAVQDALSTGSNFYTITYAPNNQKLDTRFRTISVKVDRPNLNLTYRNGYYAIDPGTSLSGAKIPRPTAVQGAMLHGAPDMTEVLFKVRTVRALTTEVGLPTDNQRISPEMKPPYRRYSLSYTTDIHNIAFTQGPDGNYTADFEFQVTVFSAATGDALNTTNREVRPVEPASSYQSLLKNGAIAHQEIDVPSKGDFFLRVVVHDLNTDRVGSMEIPTASIKSDPVPAVASGQNP
jgi:VWFA-related protein